MVSRCFEELSSHVNDTGRQLQAVIHPSKSASAARHISNNFVKANKVTHVCQLSLLVLEVQSGIISRRVSARLALSKACEHAGSFFKNRFCISNISS